MPIRTLNIGPAPGEGREQGTPWHWLTDPSTDCAQVLEGIKCHAHCREEEEDEEEKEEDHRGVTAAETLTVLKGKILGTLETKYWLWQPRRQLSFSFPTLLSIIAREDPISDKKPERFKAWLKTLHKPGSASSFPLERSLFPVFPFPLTHPHHLQHLRPGTSSISPFLLKSGSLSHTCCLLPTH